MQTSPEARLIGADRVAQALSPERAESLVRSAMLALAEGSVLAPPRQAVQARDGGLQIGMMPGLAEGLALSGVKVVGLMPGGGHAGLVLLYSTDGPGFLGAVDASSLTAIRTAAASALATRLMAAKPPSRLALLGSGAQAKAHLRHFASAFGLKGIVIWSRDHAHAKRLAVESEASNVPIAVAQTVEEAVDGADVVCTLTSSKEPILRGALIKGGVHVNLVGSSFAGSREVDDALVAKSRYVVDDETSARAQAGEFLSAIASGAIVESHIAGDLGGVLSGRIEGRRSSDEVTVFKSLGSIAQDLYAANFVVRHDEASRASADWGA